MKKKIFNYMILLAGTMGILFSSCENVNEPILLDNSDRYVAFEQTTGQVSEASVQNPIAIPINYVATENDHPKVTLELSTEGFDNPAVEGEDFTISTKEVTFENGIIDSIYVTPIDNDVWDKDKHVKIMISDVPEGVGLGDSSKVTYTLTISDDEHPLGDYIGTYTADAASQTKPGEWDETWNVTTSPVEGEPTKLNFAGIGNGTKVITATLDLENNTISFAAGQTITSSGFELEIYSMYYDAAQGYLYTDAEDTPLTGTLNTDGSIVVENWGQIISAGEYEGSAWDAFDVTFNPSAK